MKDSDFNVKKLDMPKGGFAINIRTVEEEAAFVLLQENFTDSRWAKIIYPENGSRLEYFKAVREKGSVIRDPDIEWDEIDIVGMVNDYGSFGAVAHELGVRVKKVQSHYRRAIGDNGPLNKFN